MRLVWCSRRLNDNYINRSCHIFGNNDKEKWGALAKPNEGVWEGNSEYLKKRNKKFNT